MYSLDVDFTATELLQLGCAAMGLKMTKKSIPLFEKVLELDPKQSDALVNLGGVYLNLKTPEIAVERLRRALAINPDNYGAHLNIGVALQLCLKLDEARDHMMKALALNPPYAGDCWRSMSMNSQYRGNIRQAISEYQMAMEVNPGNYLDPMSIGMLQMLLGEWDEGLVNYEARLEKTKPYPSELIEKYQHGPENSLDGKNALICGEQGIGDCIQFARYLPLLKRLHPTSTFTVFCHDSIAPWMSQYGMSVVAPGSGGTFAADIQIPMMSLMRYLKDHGQPFVIPEVYPPGFPRLAKAGGIGYCWRGNSDHSHDRFRSMKLDTMLGVMGQMPPKYHPVCLQYDATPEEKSYFDQVPILSSWHHTALAIQALDAVVTVDTAVAHMAGTLGVPTFLLMPVITDWRWGMEGEATPWYGSVRIFRQRNLGEWGPVIEDATTALFDLISMSKERRNVE